MLKIEPLEITSFFLQQFFSISGERSMCSPPGEFSVHKTFRFSFYMPWRHGRSQDFFGGGEHFFKKFSKLFKKFLNNFVKIYKKVQKKFQKYFSKFQKKFQKNYKKIVKKIAKRGFFSIFFEKFNKPIIQFSHVWTENAICTKVLRKFSNIF